MSDKKVAIIAPIGLLEQYSTCYHLVLTQYYLRHPEYARFFRSRRAAGDFIMLDNGAAELKKSITVESIIEVAEELGPNLVIAPDTIYDMDATLTATNDFLTDYARDLHSLNISIMGVPQGANKEQWMACYAAFNEDPRIDWLGISMFYTPKFERRLEALRAIASTVRKPCHLLGLWDNPYELLEERKFDFVRSVDTAKAIEFALEGLTLREWLKHKHLDDDWYFGLSKAGVAAHSSLIMQNVNGFIRLFEEGHDGY